tara:strand:+ start:69906 stop:70208 length:303 start_codon:yes stop_codon:yes gene_type:complete
MTSITPTTSVTATLSNAEKTAILVDRYAEGKATRKEINAHLASLNTFDRDSCLSKLIYRAGSLGNNKDVVALYKQMNLADLDRTLELHNVYDRAVAALLN